MASAGSSGTPLARKLGLKEGMTIRLVEPRENYRVLLEDWPSAIEQSEDPKRPKDFIHVFARDAATLKPRLEALKGEMRPAAALWISWPKKSARIATDVSEGLVREKGLAAGLVDVKVAAVDATWSGLKFVIPVKDRRSEA